MYVCIRTWQSLVSVDPTDSIVAFESEKITAVSHLFWCKFSRHSAVHMASISPSKDQRQSNVFPVAYSRRKVHSKCQHQHSCIRLFENHL
jgi:hypothetical protein